MKKLSFALIIFAVVAAKISFHQTGEQVLDYRARPAHRVQRIARNILKQGAKGESDESKTGFYVGFGVWILHFCT